VCRSRTFRKKKNEISCPWPELNHESADVRSVYTSRHSGSANYIHSVFKLLYLANDGTGCVKQEIKFENQNRVCLFEHKFNFHNANTRQSQWPRGLRRGTAAAGSNPTGGIDICLL